MTKWYHNLSNRGQLFVAYAALALVTVLVYGQCLSFELMDGWDDTPFFLKRLEVVNWSAASWYERLATPDTGYPTPVPTLLWALTHQLPQAWLVPAANTLNVVTHLIALAGAMACLWKLTGRVGLTFLAAAIWATHPLLAEAVCWVTNLKYTAMGAALFWALYLWLRAMEAEGRLWPFVAGFLGLSLIAAGCHPQALAIAPVAGVWLWFDRAEFDKPKLFALAASAASLFVASLALAIFATTSHDSLVEEAARGAGFEVDFIGRLGRVGAALFLQVRNALAPTELHPVYMPSDGTQLYDYALGGLVVAVVLVVLLGWAWFKRHRSLELIAAAACLYIPVSGISFLPRLTADAYAYLPLPFVAGALVVALQPLASKPNWKRPALILAASICLIMTGFSFLQAQRWQDELTLMLPVIERDPGSPLPYRIIAGDLGGKERYGEAIVFLEEGLPHMQKNGLIPDWALRVYVEAERYDKAFGLGLRILEQPGESSVFAHSFVVTMVAQGIIEVQPNSKALATVVSSTEHLLELGELDPDTARDLADSLEPLGHDDLARRLRETAKRAQPEPLN